MMEVQNPKPISSPQSLPQLQWLQETLHKSQFLLLQCSEAAICLQCILLLGKCALTTWTPSWHDKPYGGLRKSLQAWQQGSHQASQGCDCGPGVAAERLRGSVNTSIKAKHVEPQVLGTYGILMNTEYWANGSWSTQILHDPCVWSQPHDSYWATRRPRRAQQWSQNLPPGTTEVKPLTGRSWKFKDLKFKNQKYSKVRKVYFPWDRVPHLPCR